MLNASGCWFGATESRQNMKNNEPSRGRRRVFGTAAAVAALVLSAGQAFAAYTLSAAFQSAGITTTVPASSHSTLQFTLSSQTGDAALPGAGFTVNLPTGLRVFTTPGVVNTCGGSVTAAANATTITVSGATVPANGASCTINVEIYNAAGALNGSCANTAVLPASNFTVKNTSFTGVVPGALTV